MNSATSALMLVLLALVVSYPIGAALGIIFGLVRTAADKLCCFWNDHELAPKRWGGREVDESSAPQLMAILQHYWRNMPETALIPGLVAGAAPASCSPDRDRTAWLGL